MKQFIQYGVFFVAEGGFGFIQCGAEGLDRFQRIDSIRAEDAHHHVRGSACQSAGGAEAWSDQGGILVRRGASKRGGEQERQMACECQSKIVRFGGHFDQVRADG